MATARRIASWLASPLAYPSVQIARQTRCRVLLGPFAEMRYPFAFVAAGEFTGPVQVGSYEAELHETVEQIIEAGPEVIVNVGAGVGYYAVGLASRLPAAAIVAFEAEARARAAGERLAALNGVADRIDARGACTPADLASLEDLVGSRSTCLLMDCEGCELELADPAHAGWIARASLLVELHASVDADVAERVQRRLEATHETDVIACRPPWAGRFGELSRLRGLRHIDRELLVAEFRHGGQDWLWATPR